MSSTKVVEIRARVRQRARQGPLLVGVVTAAPATWAPDSGPMPPSALRLLGTGQKVIFWRVQKRWDYFHHNISRSVGCDRAAWDEALRLGARFMVTYAEDKGRMAIAAASSFTFDLNFGQGLQARSRDFLTVEGVAQYKFGPGKPDEIITVDSRDE